MKCVIMVQESKYRWKLVSSSGKIILDNITVHSEYAAEAFVKSYVSSFLCWSYELKPKVFSKPSEK